MLPCSSVLYLPAGAAEKPTGLSGVRVDWYTWVCYCAVGFGLAGKVHAQLPKLWVYWRAWIGILRACLAAPVGTASNPPKDLAAAAYSISVFAGCVVQC